MSITSFQLILDDCITDSLPPLRNVRVSILPPNTTSRVQPLDAGIITWVKANYNHRLLFRVFYNIGMGKKSIYNIDTPTAMWWMKEEWESCPRSVIKNLFLHCLKQAETYTRRRGVIPIEKNWTVLCVMQPSMVLASLKLVWTSF